MLGKLSLDRKPQLLSKFNRLVELYVKLLCAEKLKTQFIPLIERALLDIANKLDLSDFTALLQSQKDNCNVKATETLPPVPSLFDPLDENRYIEIVKHSIAYNLSKQYQETADSAVTALESIDKNIPSGSTKKAWLEKNENRIKELRNLRDESRKMVTFTRNNVDAQEVISLAKKQYKENNKTVFQNEITMRLTYLLDRVFIEEKQNEQFYPTPDDIVQRYIIDYLKKENLSEKPTVLEPSAGRANIADAIRTSYPQATIDVCEINPIRREILELKNYAVRGEDFMKFGVKSVEDGKTILKKEYLNRYDAIVMNPPYNSGMDIRHVKRAYEFLKPNGILIALISEGSAFSIKRKDAAAFEIWLKKNGVVDKIYIDNKEYSKMLDRPIAIGIGVIIIKKPFPVEQSEDVQHQHIDWQAADINYIATDNKNFVPAQIIMTNEKLIQPPQNDYIPQQFKAMNFIRDYVFFGVNKAIESLKKTGGFLLADGTGAGKTIQCLLVARYYYLTTGKPVLIFTVDDRVMQSGVFGDAQKLGMKTPDKIELDNSKTKVPNRPKNYAGLYGLEGAEKEISVFAFDIKSPKLKDGINVTTYYNLSQWQGAEVEQRNMKRVAEAKKQRDKFYSQMRKEIRDEVDAEFPKDPKNQRRKEGYKAELDSRLAASYDLQRNDTIYVEFINATEALNHARLDAMKKWCGTASLVIFDEAHKIKNAGRGDGDASAQRAELGRAITESAEKVMFVTATPCDRPGDLLYLKRAGLFKSDEQFRDLMSDIGVYWIEPKFNDKAEMIAFGRWDFADMDALGATQRLGDIFDTLYEDGYMLRRELELKNLNVHMDKIEMPPAVVNLMDAIEEALTIEDSDGRERKNLADIYNRQLEELEEHKLNETIRITNEALNKGHNIVIFVRSVDTGHEPRPWSGKPKPGAVRILKEKFEKMYGADKVGVIVGTTNEYEDFRRLENVSDFQARKRRILIGTVQSGGTGLNLDDTVGNAPRTMIVVTSPLSFIDVVQAVGRIVRANTKSLSECHFLFAGNVAVDLWLSNLLATKFATLHATVKGEISALNVEGLKNAEAAGESGVVNAINADTNKNPRHSRFKKGNSRIEGWVLPSKIPLYVELSGTPKNTLISFGAKKEQRDFLENWIETNKDFVEKWNITRSPDQNYQKYNGRYYGRVFHDREQCWNLWNALLNVVDPESVMYSEPTVQMFKVGDKVKFLRNMGMEQISYGESGTVIKVRSIEIGKNSDGKAIYEFRYDVEAHGNIAKRVPVTALDFSEARKYIVFSEGTKFREKQRYNRDSEKPQYTYYTVKPYIDNDYTTVNCSVQSEVVIYAKDRRGWGFDYDKPLGVELSSYIHGEIFDIDKVLEKLKSGDWECVECDTTIQKLTTGKGDNTYSLVAGLSDKISESDGKISLKHEKLFFGDKISESDGKISLKREKFFRLFNLFHRKKTDNRLKPTLVPTMESLFSRIGKKLHIDIPEQCPPLDKHGKRDISPQAIKQLIQCIAAFPSTKSLNTDTQGNYHPERKLLHRKIIREFTKTLPCKVQKPIAIFTGGASGSGKSSFLKKYASYMTGDKILKVDIDAMRDYLPEYFGWNADCTQQEVKDIYNQLIDEIGKKCSYDLIIDGTMNKVKNYHSLIDRLRSLGYRIYIIYIRVTKETSLHRVRERYVRSGRFVPDFVVDEIFANGEQPMRELTTRADGFMIVDNTGHEPRIVEIGGEQIPKTRDYGFNK